MTAQQSTNVEKRCSFPWSTRRVSVCVLIQDEIMAHPVCCLTTKSSAQTGQMILQGIMLDESS